MEIYISIDGVLRNTLQKFEYHYRDHYLDSETENKEDFIYRITSPITNINPKLHYSFQSDDEYKNFTFIEYSMEIFGHAGLSYSNVATELNKFIHENKEHNITLVGLNHLGKSKPATLFFLSKNAVICDNIKFVSDKNIDKLWKECEVWISDDEKIINKCPKGKVSIKFNNEYNSYFYNKLEINKLSEIKTTWLNSSEKTITSILMQLVKNVKSLLK